MTNQKSKRAKAPVAEGGEQKPRPENEAGQSKLAALIALLRSPEGATLPQMTTATGWQAHSVRGAMSGALKKKQGLTITSEKTEAGRVYRIVEAA